MYFGIISGVWAIGSVSGPVIGGVLAFKASWVRPVWLLNLTDRLANNN
jgi:MFS family permease